MRQRNFSYQIHRLGQLKGYKEMLINAQIVFTLCLCLCVGEFPFHTF